MWLPALAGASIIKVIMAGQRMRQPARGRNGSSATVSTGDRRIHRSVPDPAWSLANARHGAAGGTRT
jgi:hypothetical protein